MRESSLPAGAEDRDDARDEGTLGVGTARPRYQRADRAQLQWLGLSVDELVPADHRVRGVWAYVTQMDLEPLYASIKAVEGRAGRSPIDPRILMALWLYATLEGIGSARELARLSVEHTAYLWICGGVKVNHHTLSDFRTNHVAVLDALLTESVATLVAAGVTTLNRVAQDGVRVRASAGSKSFRRRPMLEQLLGAAEEQVRTLKAELNENPAASQRREVAARERAARERAARVTEALRQMPALEQKRKAAGTKGPARISTTDPDARTMKMPGGGFQAAYNVQFATDTQSQVIVGVDVTNQGSDQGQLAPMAAQIEKRHGRAPTEYLADGGFVKHDDINQLAANGTAVYAPVPPPKNAARGATGSCPQDTPALAAWRQRMGTAAAGPIYKERASTAECVNAQGRNRGLTQFLVRGLGKVLGVALWFALAHNVARWMALTLGASTS